LKLLGEHRDLPIVLARLAGALPNRGIALGRDRFELREERTALLALLERGAQLGVAIVLTRSRAQHDGVALVGDDLRGRSHQGLARADLADDALADLAALAFPAHEPELRPALDTLKLPELDDDALGVDGEDGAFLRSAHGWAAHNQQTDERNAETAG